MPAPASASAAQSPVQVFDRRLLRHRRDRAAAGLADYDFLLTEVGERLADRLDDIRRRFPMALDLGCHHGALARCLNGRGGVERLIQTDLSPRMAAAAPSPALAADEEALPFAAGTFDAAFSLLSLHWVNDLPGTLLQLRHALKPDGLLLVAMLGGDTLHELRTALAEAEMDLEGGLSPRVSPFADVRDAGMLLQRAGFALPVVDRETLTVSYADAFRLMRDLRGMAAANAVAERRRGMTRRATLLAAATGYADRFADADGRIPATFEVLYLTAWAPHPEQPRPLRPGSAASRLADALGTEELSAGEKARPG
ncbi:MAG: methyltransferase domain-containing protein [Rhodospirillales bacterium]|nr:MAG: methyltransferase domain-containing protein [Rhodospirillales bacterium]